MVYHGTRHEFSRFDIDKGQVGVHFSVSPEVANAFARSQGGEGGSVIPALIVRYTATLRVICHRWYQTSIKKKNTRVICTASGLVVIKLNHPASRAGLVKAK